MDFTTHARLFLQLKDLRSLYTKLHKKNAGKEMDKEWRKLRKAEVGGMNEDETAAYELLHDPHGHFKCVDASTSVTAAVSTNAATVDGGKSKKSKKPTQQTIDDYTAMK